MIADEQVAALGDALAGLRDRVERLERTERRGASAVRVPSGLLELGDLDSASAREWASLVRWVRGVAIAYQLDNHDLPACWHLHGPYVRELAALQYAHVSALLSLGREPRAMVVWHADLHTVVTRLHASHVGQRCATTHVDAAVARTERTARIVNAHRRDGSSRPERVRGGTLVYSEPSRPPT